MKISELELETTDVIDAEDSLRQAARRMDDGGFREVAVLKDGRVMGTVTDRDIMRSVVAHGLDADRVHVGEIQGEEGKVFFAGMEARQAAELMRSKGLQRAVVVNSRGEVLGLAGCRQLERACQSESTQDPEGGRFLGFNTPE